MKPNFSLFVLICTAILSSDSFAAGSDTASNTIGQQNYQYEYGSVKGIIKPSYVVTPKPFAEPINIKAPLRPGENDTDQSENHSYVVYFDFGSSRLSGSEKQKLYRSAIILDKKSVASVTGYTCPVGTFAANHRLAWERAENVAAFLRKHGVNVRQISGKPQCCYVSASDPDKNRRVEIDFDPETKFTR